MTTTNKLRLNVWGASGYFKAACALSCIMAQLGCGETASDSSGPNLSSVRSSYTFDACSASQQAQLETDKIIARSILDSAFVAVNSGDPLYNRWLGEWDSDRGAFLTNILTELQNAWDTQVIHCVAEDGPYATAGGLGSSDVSLYNVWWAGPPSFPPFQGEAGGQADTLLHEFTHLLGTGDNGNWGRDCLNFSKTNPELAINTAACIQYFMANNYQAHIAPVLDVQYL